MSIQAPASCVTTWRYVIRGQLDFTVPLFAEYLTENHPLETFEESA